jgi:hypothetical protein
MDWFLDLVGHLPDSLVLLGGALLTGLAALLIAGAARRVLFADRESRPDHRAKLEELVHGSLLAFTVFTLALVLSDVRTNLGKTLDSTLREASVITRLDAELQVAGGAAAETARQDLRRYAGAVVAHDWPALGKPGPRLSAEASDALAALRASGRAAARASPESASTITAFLTQIEDYRFGRLESATKTVTNVFWWIIFAFLVGAMAMNGRHPVDLGSASLIFLHMAGIGLVLALIVVMDQPFRGETSVSADAISAALPALDPSG